MARLQQGRRLIKPVIHYRFTEQRRKLRRHVTELNPVLGAFRPGQTWRYVAQVELDDLRIINFPRLSHAKQTLGLEVRGKRFNLRCGTPGALKVLDGLFINWEESHRCAIFRRHIADGGTVWQT